MTPLDDAHATLQRTVADPDPKARALLSRAQAAALLDEAARLRAKWGRTVRRWREARDARRVINAWGDDTADALHEVEQQRDDALDLQRITQAGFDGEHESHVEETARRLRLERERDDLRDRLVALICRWRLYSDPYHGPCADELAAALSGEVDPAYVAYRAAAEAGRWVEDPRD